MSEPRRPWSVPLRVGDVPDDGLRIEIEADEATRVAVARVAGLDAVLRLEAAFDIAHHGRGGLHVQGRVAATVGQTCVVSLEPVTNDIVEPVDLVFRPASRIAAGPGPAALELDPEAREAAEALVDGGIDLGAIATEFLILGIDPYPRKPGVMFEAPQEPEPGGSPFAALGALKRP